MPKPRVCPWISGMFVEKQSSLTTFYFRFRKSSKTERQFVNCQTLMTDNYDFVIIQLSETERQFVNCQKLMTDNFVNCQQTCENRFRKSRFVRTSYNEQTIKMFGRRSPSCARKHTPCACEHDQGFPKKRSNRGALRCASNANRMIVL